MHKLIMAMIFLCLSCSGPGYTAKKYDLITYPERYISSDLDVRWKTIISDTVAQTDLLVRNAYTNRIEQFELTAVYTDGAGAKVGTTAFRHFPAGIDPDEILPVTLKVSLTGTPVAAKFTYRHFFRGTDDNEPKYGTFVERLK